MRSDIELLLFCTIGQVAGAGHQGQSGARSRQRNGAASRVPPARPAPPVPAAAAGNSSSTSSTAQQQSGNLSFFTC